ncbi:hypothetical protein BJ165DRAFT_1607392 [Panaeolus papilionaceus]|nr:hypothetical protein BJ165DRAFT_1607392 [Panaeolus papilionaceus]
MFIPPLCTWGSQTREELLLKDDIIIATLGKSGSGKSNFIDKLVGGKSAREDLRPPSDRSIKRVRIPGNEVYGNNLVLLDTPGLDGEFTEEKAVEMIQKFVKKYSEKRDKILDGIIRFHPMSDNRLDMKAPTTRKARLCTDPKLTRVVLLTTMWDRAQSVKQKDTFNSRRQELSHFWKPLLDAGATQADFNNTPESAWSVINAIARVEPIRCEPPVLSPIPLLSPISPTFVNRTFQFPRIESPIPFPLEPAAVERSLKIKIDSPCEKRRPRSMSDTQTWLESNNFHTPDSLHYNPFLTFGELGRENMGLEFLMCRPTKVDGKFSDTTFIIVVVGARGSGKGKFIDFIKDGGAPLASNNLGASSDLRDVDKTKISNHRSKYPDYGSRLVLLYTPGYEEVGNITLASTLKAVQHELKDTVKSPSLKIGVMFLYDIRKGEAKGLMPCLEDLRTICQGTDNLGDRVMVLTTFWDGVDERKHQQYEAVLKNLPKSRQWQALAASGVRIEQHTNTEQSAFNAVSTLLQSLQSS